MAKENAGSKNFVLLAALVSAAVTFGVYLPSLGHGFVLWDDQAYVYDNLNIRGLDLKWAFTAQVAGTWLPLTLLSFTLDYAVWGLDPFGYHLANSILHAANTLLVALLAARLADMKGGFQPKALFLVALASGLLFGIHPMHVESVAWVSERKDVLNALFFLLGVHAYLSYAKAPSKSSRYYLLTLFFFILSLLSKPMTVTMPLVLLIIDFFPLERLKETGWKTLLIEKLPFFGLSLITGVISVWSQIEGDALNTMAAHPLVPRLHVAVRGFLFYIHKTLVPMGLAPLYPDNFEMGLNIRFAAYASALAAITGVTVLMLRRSRAFLSAWAYYLVTLLPVIGVVQVGGQAAADRYMYIPSISLVVLAAVGAGWAVRRNGKAFAPVIAAVAVISVLLSLLTVKQISIWKDTVSLWTRETKVFPAFGKGYYLLGHARVHSGSFSQAIEDLNKAIDLRVRMPDLQTAYLYRGIALCSVGRVPEGLEDITAAIYLDPLDKVAYRNRGAAYTMTGEYEKAIEDFRKAASLEPVEASAYTDLGLAYMKLGQRENALMSMQKAVGLGDENALQYVRQLVEADPRE